MAKRKYQSGDACFPGNRAARYPRENMLFVVRPCGDDEGSVFAKPVQRGMWPIALCPLQSGLGGWNQQALFHCGQTLLRQMEELLDKPQPAAACIEGRQGTSLFGVQRESPLWILSLARSKHRRKDSF
jgi:hypothetical protein